MKYLSIILAFAILGLVTSCKKDETVTPTKTKTQLITAKVWIPNQVIASGSTTVYQRGTTPTSLWIDLDKVSLTFKADGSITGTDPTGKALSGAKWNLSTDETKIIISGSGIAGLDGEGLIVQLTDTNFEVKGTFVYQGIPIVGNLKMI
jgi:hypothetical protein